MKKKFLGLMMTLVAASMMLVSCGKSESKQIVGTWTNTDQSYVELTANGNLVFQEPLGAGEITMTFNEDGTMGENAKAKWTAEDGVLTITDGKDVMKYDIITLDKDVLVLEESHTEVVNGLDNVTVNHFDMVKVK